MESKELQSKMSEIKQFGKKESEYEELDEMRNQLKQAQLPNIENENLGSSSVEVYSYSNYESKSANTQIGNIFAQIQNRFAENDKKDQEIRISVSEVHDEDSKN